MRAGIIDEHPAAELTHMLVASIEEAAMLVAHSPEPDRARVRAAQILDRLLDGFARRRRKTVQR
jgi:hypothetical protein